MTLTTTKSWEINGSDPGTLAWLKKIVRSGEGKSLEFKQKASFPDKIVREMVAFANTEGGILLIGVTDSGILTGLKFPEEDQYVLKQAIRKFIRPGLVYQERIIPISAKRAVLYYKIFQSKKKPHFIVLSRSKRESFVRVDDRSIKASHEVKEIARRTTRPMDVHFTYGSSEQLLLRYLNENNSITLTRFAEIADLTRFSASRKLITLVLANILHITPDEKGDRYSLAYSW